jgi:uncharacterized protein
MPPPEYALPASRWQREAIAFFDRIVHGADTGYAARQAPVYYHLDGTDDDYRAAHKVMVHAAMLQDII